jgi:hypothetical protein
VTVSAGFGETSFYMHDGKLKCDNETMGPLFITSVLGKLVDAAEMDS